MAQPILSQSAQWPDRVAEVQTSITREQAHQGGPTAWHRGPTVEADRGQRARDPD